MKQYYNSLKKFAYQPVIFRSKRTRPDLRELKNPLLVDWALRASFASMSLSNFSSTERLKSKKECAINRVFSFCLVKWVLKVLLISRSLFTITDWSLGQYNIHDQITVIKVVYSFKRPHTILIRSVSLINWLNFCRGVVFVLFIKSLYGHKDDSKNCPFKVIPLILLLLTHKDRAGSFVQGYILKSYLRIFY